MADWRWAAGGRRGTIALCAMLCAALPLPAAARPAPPAFLTFGRAIDPPRGFVELCANMQAICDRMAQGAAATVPDGPPLRALLGHVNGRVNASVRQQPDARTYGHAELWRPSGEGRGAAGDCEDIAIQKRLDLIAAGFPPDRLFFALVYRSGVGLHLVLVARLDEGDVVLDSRVDYIQRWSSAGYSWIGAQSPAAPATWRALH